MVLIFFILSFRFRMDLASLRNTFTVGIKLVLCRYLIVVLLHDQYASLSLSTNTTIREYLFFEKLEENKEDN